MLLILLYKREDNTTRECRAQRLKARLFALKQTYALIRAVKSQTLLNMHAIQEID